MKRWARHTRFLIAFGLGLAVTGVTFALDFDLILQALLSVNGFFITYLVLMLAVTQTMTADDLRKHSELEDEGITLIVVLALGTVTIAMASVVLVLSQKSGSTLQNILALAAVPLGWATMHMLAAYHYAHMYYTPDPDAGLKFPGDTDGDPGAWDFLYFAYTIGMTAQVADVQVTTSPLRRVVLTHSIGSFFYNTVVLALAVNAALQLGE